MEGEGRKRGGRGGRGGRGEGEGGRGREGERKEVEGIPFAVDLPCVLLRAELHQLEVGAGEVVGTLFLVGAHTHCANLIRQNICYKG